MKKINYSSIRLHTRFRVTVRQTFINRIALNVRDENGDLFDFNVLPLESELGTN